MGGTPKKKVDNVEIKIERKKLSDLNPAPYNPRKISDEQLSGLTNSVKRFGIVEPIVWNKRTGNIVGGHQRYKSLQRLGKTETDVVVVDLSETEEKALNVTLNNKHIAGEFTEDISVILGELSESLPEFNDLRLDVLMEEFGPSENIVIEPKEWEIGNIEIPAWVVIRLPISRYSEVMMKLEELDKSGLAIETSEK